MKTILMKSHFFPTQIKTIPTPKSSFYKFPSYHNTSQTKTKTKSNSLSSKNENKSHNKEERIENSYEKELKTKRRRRSLQLLTGAASVGLLMMMMGQDKAWALGPEGPLVEEFWENVRRYGLYALTVSTGAIWALLQPIVELLKNPISAILIIIIIGGSFFIFSQILSAMVGVSDFSYQYGY